MKQIAITIYGASDDLVEVESSDDSIREEYDIYEPVTLTVEAPVHTTGEEPHRLEVRVDYGSRDWELSVVTATSYSEPWPYPITLGRRPGGDQTDPALIISAPEGTTVRLAD